MPATQEFGENNVPTFSARRGVAITPHNSNELAAVPRAIYIGGTGDLVVVGLDDVEVTFSNVSAGTVLPFMAKIIKSTGTTATLILALY